jgi:hypothetical protein
MFARAAAKPPAAPTVPAELVHQVARLTAYGLPSTSTLSLGPARAPPTCRGRARAPSRATDRIRSTIYLPPPSRLGRARPTAATPNSPTQSRPAELAHQVAAGLAVTDGIRSPVYLDRAPNSPRLTVYGLPSTSILPIGRARAPNSLAGARSAGGRRARCGGRRQAAASSAEFGAQLGPSSVRELGRVRVWRQTVDRIQSFAATWRLYTVDVNTSANTDRIRWA